MAVGVEGRSRLKALGEESYWVGLLPELPWLQKDGNHSNADRNRNVLRIRELGKIDT